MKDIESKADVTLFVDKFYEQIRAHQILGPIFNDKIGDHWPEHLENLGNFWETLLLNNRTYFGRPFPKHISLPIEDQHFDMWLGLFHQTIDDLFTGVKADEAKARATNIAYSFRFKLAHMRSQQ